MSDRSAGRRAHSLFSFGTLLEERVQIALFGHPVPSYGASLVDYATRPLAITDASVIATSGSEVHLTLECRRGSVVTGGVLHLSDRELATADAYEVDDYVRRRVHLASGESAWAYLDAQPLRAASRVVVVAADQMANDERLHQAVHVASLGSSLTDIAEQLPALLLSHNPDTIVVVAGIDDAASPSLARDLSTLAEIAQRHNARLVMTGPMVLRDRCTENHVDYLDA